MCFPCVYTFKFALRCYNWFGFLKISTQMIFSSYIISLYLESPVLIKQQSMASSCQNEGIDPLS